MADGTVRDQGSGIRDQGALAPLLAGLIASLAACGGGAESAPPAAAVATAPSGPVTFVNDDASWGRFHSKRHLLSIPLPDGHAWKIDDTRTPDLVATHAPTSSKLRVTTTREPELMSRQRCEARARDAGWVPQDLTTVEEHVQTGPEAYDSRIWVALQPGKPGAPVVGHVFLFGGFLRQCLLVHYRTEVASAQEEDALSSRLAVVRARVLGGLQIDPPRTTDDAEVPRTKPSIVR